MKKLFLNFGRSGQCSARIAFFFSILIAALSMNRTTDAATLELGGDFVMIDAPDDWSQAISDEGFIELKSPSGFCEVLIVPSDAPGVPAPRTDLIVGIGSYDALDELLAIFLNAMANYMNVFDTEEDGVEIHNIEIVEDDYGNVANMYYYGSLVLNRRTVTGSWPLFVRIFFDGETALLLIGKILIPFASDNEMSQFSITMSSIYSENIDSPLSDTDGDGISNYDENVLFGTDPSKADTFSDGILDAEAIAAGLPANLDYMPLLESARLAGQDDVLASPSEYNLFSQTQLDSLVESTTQAIILDPSSVGLFANQENVYFSLGPTLTQLEQNGLTLDWSLTRSEDLSIWEEIGTIEIAVPKQDTPYFFRFELDGASE